MQPVNLSLQPAKALSVLWRGIPNIMLPFILATVLLQTPQKLPTGDRNAGNLYLSWSADGKWLAYTQIELGDPPKFDPDKVSAFIVSSDGNERKRLDGPAMNIALTCDGNSAIITRRGIDGKKNVMMRYDLGTKQTTPLSPNDYNTTCPACSPVDDWIAVSSDRDGDDLQIFLMRKDGSGFKKITHGPGKAYNPMWSADGKRIVYYRELGDHKDQIFTVDPNGSNEKHISKSDEHNFYPSFLANGDISYTNMTAGEDSRRVIIVDSDGKFKSAFKYDTATLKWSPKGDKVAFFAGGFPRSAVYIANADGSNPIKVSE